MLGLTLDFIDLIALAGPGAAVLVALFVLGTRSPGPRAQEPRPAGAPERESGGGVLCCLAGVLLVLLIASA